MHSADRLRVVVRSEYIAELIRRAVRAEAALAETERQRDALLDERQAWMRRGMEGLGAAV